MMIRSNVTATLATMLLTLGSLAMAADSDKNLLKNDGSL